jgi:hydroxyacyl-ACP dehydratase HTD2-like protein with hotdog domain
MRPRLPSSQRVVQRQVCASCGGSRIDGTRWQSTRQQKSAEEEEDNKQRPQQQEKPKEDGGNVGAAMRRRCPSKTIPDYLTPLPSYQLSVLLDDLMGQRPCTSPSPKVTSPPSVLPQGAHLVYFPPLASASALAVDGADADHVPPSFHLAAYGEGIGGGGGGGGAGGRRLWSGGEVLFRKGWARGLRLDGRPWTCREKIGEVDVRRSDTDGSVKGTKVDIWRRYGLGHDDDDDIGVVHEPSDGWLVSERRTLAFVPENGPDAPQSRASRIVKCKFISQPLGRTILQNSLRSRPSCVEESDLTIAGLARLTPTYTSPWITPSPTHLFHFSALSYNAHFIHLQPPPTALVHGPLLLAMMLRVLGAWSPVESITYRNLAPLMVGQPLRICLRESQGSGGSRIIDIWVEGPEGGLAVRGKAVTADDVD